MPKRSAISKKCSPPKRTTRSQKSKQTPIIDENSESDSKSESDDLSLKNYHKDDRNGVVADEIKNTNFDSDINKDIDKVNSQKDENNDADSQSRDNDSQSGDNESQSVKDDKADSKKDEVNDGDCKNNEKDSQSHENYSQSDKDSQQSRLNDENADSQDYDDNTSLTMLIPDIVMDENHISTENNIIENDTNPNSKNDKIEEIEKKKAPDETIVNDKTNDVQIDKNSVKEDNNHKINDSNKEQDSTEKSDDKTKNTDTKTNDKPTKINVLDDKTGELVETELNSSVNDSEAHMNSTDDMKFPGPLSGDSDSDSYFVKDDGKKAAPPVAEFIEIDASFEPAGSPSDCVMMVENVQVDIDPSSLMMDMIDDDVPDPEPTETVVIEDDKPTEPVSLLTSSDESDVILQEPHIDTVEVSDATSEDSMPLQKLVKPKEPVNKKLQAIFWGTNSDCPCYSCGFSCTSRAELSKHRKTCQKYKESEDKPAEKKLYVCPTCAYETPHKHVYDKHKKKHSVKNTKMFKCTQCNYRAKHKMNLAFHMKTHTEVYKCNVCEFHTKVVADMHTHVRSHATVKVNAGQRKNVRRKKRKAKADSSDSSSSSDDEYVPGRDV